MRGAAATLTVPVGEVRVPTSGMFSAAALAFICLADDAPWNVKVRLAPLASWYDWPPRLSVSGTLAPFTNVSRPPDGTLTAVGVTARLSSSPSRLMPLKVIVGAGAGSAAAAGDAMNAPMLSELSVNTPRVAAARRTRVAMVLLPAGSRELDTIAVSPRSQVYVGPPTIFILHSLQRSCQPKVTPEVYIFH